MSIQACAELVRRGDPDRFMSAMTAPPDQRAALFTLYAFNLEVARAPWVTSEPMIAEMRLQWWLDAVEEIFEGQEIRRHEVVTPLADLVSKRDLPRASFDTLITARRADIYPSPPENQAVLNSYLADTGGALMQLACCALHPIDAHTWQAVGAIGEAQATANFLLAVPELERRQRAPFYDGSADGVRSLAKAALGQQAQAKRALKEAPRQIIPALRAGWLSKTLLTRAQARPERVADGSLGVSDFRKRTSLLVKSALNRF